MKTLKFGEKVVFLRRAQDLTQSGLSRKSGVPEKTLERIEAGHNAPSSAHFVRILRALKVSISVIDPSDLEQGDD